MKYIVAPQEISIESIQKHDYSLSPMQYRIIVIKNSNVKTIEELLEGELVSGTEVGSLAYTKINSSYVFLRTKTCQEDTYQLELNIPDSFEYIKPNDYFANKGKNDERVVKKNDLLFVTGGNVGEVVIAQDLHKTIFSSHFIKIPIDTYKFYIFAFLKNDFGKEQANFAPVGAIGALDTFSKDTLLSIKIPFPNQSNSNEVIKYIEFLVDAIINREAEIKRKDQLISSLIEMELLKNQRENTYSYDQPSFDEIIKTDYRLETGMYTREFKEMNYLLNNYQYGCQSLSDLDYDYFRGQNLQFSSIGKSVYSSTPKNGFYQLLLSSYISEYATIIKYEYLGNSKKLKEIEKGDVILSCRGVQFGRVCVFCEEIKNTITNIDNFHIRNVNSKVEHKIFISLFLNHLRKKGHLHRIAITGSGANSLTKYQFNLLKIPNFPNSKIEDIADLFYNPPNLMDVSVDVNNFKQKDDSIVRGSGIFQLDKQIKMLKERIKEVVTNIIDDETVEINFNFLNKIPMIP